MSKDSPETPDLGSFNEGMTAVVIGASGAIGGAFTRHLAASPRVRAVHALSRSRQAPEGEKILAGRIDLEDEDSIAAAARRIKAEHGSVDLVLVATGVLHEGDMEPEKTWRTLDAGQLSRAYTVNAIGPALAGKHFLPLLARDRKAVFAALSARIGSVSDNGFGGWHSYRASKAALNMLLRNLAIELARKNGTALCIGLHPGTVDSALSAPFQRNVPQGKLFSPAWSTARLLGVIDGLDSAASGRLFAWDGKEIQP